MTRNMSAARYIVAVNGMQWIGGAANSDNLDAAIVEAQRIDEHKNGGRLVEVYDQDTDLIVWSKGGNQA